MPTWLTDIAGPGYAGAIMWTLVALIALGIIMVVVKIVRKLTKGPYASSGSHRARLAVMDAAEVDAQRRLVLVRRDEVEHLVMIGGPTDIVIEQNITGPGRSAPLQQPSARPSMARQAEPDRPRKSLAERRPRASPVPTPVPVDANVERRDPVIAERGPQVAPAAPALAPDPTERAEPAIADRVAATEPTVDEAMVSQFERDFRTEAGESATGRREPTIEEEMDRLFSEVPRERQ